MIGAWTVHTRALIYTITMCLCVYVYNTWCMRNENSGSRHKIYKHLYNAVVIYIYYRSIGKYSSFVKLELRKDYVVIRNVYFSVCVTHIYIYIYTPYAKSTTQFIFVVVRMAMLINIIIIMIFLVKSTTYENELMMFVLGDRRNPIGRFVNSHTRMFEKREHSREKKRENERKGEGIYPYCFTYQRSFLAVGWLRVRVFG